MVYTNDLTVTQKDKKIPIVITQDGNVCYFDEMPFNEQIFGLRRTIDHLNNNSNDNRVENLGLCHFDCNQRKKNNPEMQVIAMEKFHHNLQSAPESLGEGEKKTDEDTLTEGQINETINKTVKSFLDESLSKNSKCFISYTKTLRAITYLVIEQTGGRGSETAVRRSIDAHCSDYAPWGDKKLGRGNRVIFRRGNQ